jgi:hypothetical protein
MWTSLAGDEFPVAVFASEVEAEAFTRTDDMGLSSAGPFDVGKRPESRQRHGAWMDGTQYTHTQWRVPGDYWV